MTNEQLQLQIDKLTKELQDLKNLYFKDNFSDLEIFRKKVQFRADVDLDNINKITKTGGTDVIADGNHTINIGADGGSITITSKNGVITAIS